MLLDWAGPGWAGLSQAKNSRAALLDCSPLSLSLSLSLSTLLACRVSCSHSTLVTYSTLSLYSTTPLLYSTPSFYSITPLYHATPSIYSASPTDSSPSLYSTTALYSIIPFYHSSPLLYFIILLHRSIPPLYSIAIFYSSTCSFHLYHASYWALGHWNVFHNLRGGFFFLILLRGEVSLGIVLGMLWNMPATLSVTCL